MSTFISISVPGFNRYAMMAARADNPNGRCVVLRWAYRIVFRVGKHASATLARLLNLFLRLSATFDYSHGLFLFIFNFVHTVGDPAAEIRKRLLVVYINWSTYVVEYAYRYVRGFMRDSACAHGLAIGKPH